MSFSPRMRLAVVAALLAASMAAAQQRREAQKPRMITGEGTEGFRALLASRGLKPIEDPAEALQDPKHTLVIAFRGANRFGNSYPDQIGKLGFDPKREFVDQGGALFFASDQSMGLGGSGWNRSFGFQITGSILSSAEVGPDLCYKRNPQCPFVRGIDNSVPDLFQPSKLGKRRPLDEVAESLRRVATNRPSYLLPAGDKLDDLARFEQAYRVEAVPGWRPLNLGRQYGARFAQARRYEGGGRFLVLADHSVFINSMLLPSAQFARDAATGDSANDNLAFASNCLDWLVTGPEGVTRNRVLFLEDGKIWTKNDYDLALQAVPSFKDDPLGFLKLAGSMLLNNHEQVEEILSNVERDKYISDLERGDGKEVKPLGRQLNDWITENLFEKFEIVRAVIVLGMVVLLGYGIISLIKSRFSYSRKTPRLSLALDRVKPRAGLLEMRLRGGVGRGQYYEIARDRAREMFAALDLTPAEGSPPPAITVNAGWRLRVVAERQFREIWTVAFGIEATPVTLRKWEQWHRQLDQIQSMIRRGQIRFEDSQESA